MINLDAYSAPAKTALMAELKRRDGLNVPEPSDAEAAAIAEEANSVATYGVNAPKDRSGKRQQQGIGAWPNHVTANHFSAIRRYEGEAKYQAAIRRLWKECPERAKLINLEQPERLGQ